MSDDVDDVPENVRREDRAQREQGILEASQTLGAYRSASRQTRTLTAETDMDLGEVKVHLSLHQLGRARKTLKRCFERTLEELEEDVLHLRRSIAMLHRLLVHKHISLEEAERILYKLQATAAAEIGDIRASTDEVEDLLEDMIGGNTSTLNPFLFRHFWMGVDTRWPAGGETGVLLVRIINDGPIPMPMLRLKPPVPGGLDGQPPQRRPAHHRSRWKHSASI